MVKRAIVVLFSAAVTASGILVPQFWFFSCLGIIPALAVLSDSVLSRRQSALLGWLFGVSYTLTASFCMFWPTLPLDWIGISNIWVAGLLVGFIWLSLALMIGGPFALFGLALRYSPTNAFTRTLYVASVWVLVQYLQAWCYALATLGASSAFGPHISSLMVGYTLATFSPLLQLASLGGVYALTFVVIAIGNAIYEVCQRMSRLRGALACVVLCLVLSSLTYLDERYFLASVLPSREVSGMARLALVSTSFKNAPESVLEQREHALLEVATIRDWQKPDPLPLVVVLPEDSAMLKHSGLSASAFAREAFGTTSVGLIDSSASSTGAQKYVRMTTYGPEAELRGTYDKIFLIAFGEYIPWLYSSLLRVLNNPVLNEAIAIRAVHNGDEINVVQIGPARLGSLFCMEIMSPILYRNLTLSGANVLTNSLSQSWFHGSAIMDRYTMALAKVRAAENGRYLVIAGNEFRSTVISDRGEVLSRDPGDGFSVMAADVMLFEAKTPYVLFGDGVLLVPAAYVITTLVLRRRHFLQSSR